jgi:alpha-ketoglutaric semialdehyde dehydrogenase
LKITGDMLIGSAAVRGHAGELRAIDPSSGRELAPAFGTGGKAEVDRACELAAAAFDSYRETPVQQRAHFLESIAGGLVNLGPALIDRAMAETGLPRARLEGERGRTVGQLRLFAAVARDGRWLDVTIDKALPDRVPLRRPDLRLRKIAIGPVAVFGASNFPLAFSVAGGDTASALAAGCPVVVKAHPGHLGTSELVGRVIQAAVQACGLPEGVFSLLVGAGNEIGQALVAHPAIQAVGFTGSRQGGLALTRVANGRAQPIPVYAEMSSVNPVFLLSGALAEPSDKLAQAFVDSLVLGTGQFCTNPGLVFGIAGGHFERFKAAAAKALAAKEAAVMLTQGIHSAYCSGVQRLSAVPGVRELARGQVAAAAGARDRAYAAQPALFATEAQHWFDHPELEQEVFGPAGLMVACRDVADMRSIAERLEGQLTATLQLAPSDHADARQLLPVLERKVGRVVVNGFPTGVEVSYAMVHGGPFPATSDSRSTSVGALAIERFLRPVCYQDMPPELLPVALQDSNPLGLPRLIDGTREGA